MNTTSICLYTLLYGLIFSLVSCDETIPAQPKSVGEFYKFGKASTLNSSIIQEPSAYEPGEFRELRQKFGMLPDALKQRIIEDMAIIERSFPEASMEKVLNVGFPVWERARVQPDHEYGQLLLVPLVQESSEVSEGLLVYRLRDGELDTWHLLNRDGLLRPLREDRPVQSRSEYVNLLLTASFDTYLFDRQTLPARYTLDPHMPDYEAQFDSRNVRFRDPVGGKTHFIFNCFQQGASMPEYDIVICCRYICESYYLVDYDRGILLDYSPPNVPPPANSNSGGGGTPSGTAGNNRDGLQSNGLCEWLWPVVGIYSGSSPLDDLATVIGNNPQLCYFHVGALGTIYCNWNIRHSLRGTDCTAQVIKVTDEGSSVEGPKNGEMSVYVYGRFRLENISNQSVGIHAGYKDVMGVGYEWATFREDEARLVSYTRRTTVTRGLECYDACLEN
ncbi:hypothetical protein [Lewinella sp. IMCC34183]|uniref:hypothetical protein n=1 Tax=Lewinella sp. IMCC34183 TaxID=2248762 RepID=UPI000E24F51F|nr:hypothetical protein [Lewinella sp. IMCC34183]